MENWIIGNWKCHVFVWLKKWCNLTPNTLLWKFLSTGGETDIFIANSSYDFLKLHVMFKEEKKLLSTVELYFDMFSFVIFYRFVDMYIHVLNIISVGITR